MTEMKFDISRELYDHKVIRDYAFEAKPGLSEELIHLISKEKNEPAWMLEKRLKGFEIFKKLILPKWEGSPDLTNLDLDKIKYFMKAEEKGYAKKWEDVPADIRRTFERLG